MSKATTQPLRRIVIEKYIPEVACLESFTHVVRATGFLSILCPDREAARTCAVWRKQALEERGQPARILDRSTPSLAWTHGAALFASS